MRAKPGVDRMEMDNLSANNASPTLEFGPFKLIPSSRMLLEGDKECRLGSRALEILTVLLERAGETVTKQELLTRAWPGMFVDEANLRVHIAALRKVLGDGQSGGAGAQRRSGS
jgi:DNA-binding winged helix-turn-helix (wHTH) protein